MDDVSFCLGLGANPRDGALRAAYADLLEERGDLRAEFLRLEAQLETLELFDPHAGSLRQRMLELRGGLSSDWLRQIGRFLVHAESAEERMLTHVPLVAARLGRPVREIDRAGYAIEIEDGCEAPHSSALAWLESRQRTTGGFTDIAYQLSIRAADGRQIDWTPKTYNPYFGCRIKFMEWFGDVLIAIYREKHRHYAVRLAIDSPVDFQRFDDEWLVDGFQLVTARYGESELPRFELPSLAPLPAMSLDIAQRWRLDPRLSDDS